VSSLDWSDRLGEIPHPPRAPPCSFYPGAETVGDRNYDVMRERNCRCELIAYEWPAAHKIGEAVPSAAPRKCWPSCAGASPALAGRLHTGKPELRHGRAAGQLPLDKRHARSAFFWISIGPYRSEHAHCAVILIDQDSMSGNVAAGLDETTHPRPSRRRTACGTIDAYLGEAGRRSLRLRGIK